MVPRPAESLQALLEANSPVLMEAAIVERIRHAGSAELHPSLIHAPLIYSDRGIAALSALYQEYVAIAATADLPILLCTPTWRANRERVAEAGAAPSINIDAAHFMRRFCRETDNRPTTVKIGGLIGCKNDAYRPQEAISTTQAEPFHAWQIEQLAEGGVDFLIAVTLPEVHEALGIARAMQATGLPYLISFVIARNGRLLDGTSLADAIALIDAGTKQSPTGYLVNCSYPSFLCPEQQPAGLFTRLLGIQANASSLDHCDLDGSDTLHTDSLSEWGSQMVRLHRDYGMPILGGCCGTDGNYLRYLIEHLALSRT